jgi:hypothetical protein
LTGSSGIDKLEHMTEIRRLAMGYFVRPGSETPDGAPRVEPLFAYLVRHDRGLLLFDSGIGAGTAAEIRASVECRSLLSGSRWRPHAARRTRFRS